MVGCAVMSLLGWDCTSELWSCDLGDLGKAAACPWMCFLLSWWATSWASSRGEVFLVSTFSLSYHILKEKLCDRTDQGERVALVLFFELAKCLLKSVVVLWDLKVRFLCALALCCVWSCFPHLWAIIALKGQEGSWVSSWVNVPWAPVCKDEALMYFYVSEVLCCGVEHPVYHILSLIPVTESVFRD